MRPVYNEITSNGSHEASLHALADASPLEPSCSWGCAAPQIHSVEGPTAIGYSRGLRRALMRHDFDVLHTHGLFKHTSADVHVVAKQRNTPYAVAPHGMLDAWALAQSRWKKKIALWWFESAHLRGAKCFHALCRSEAADIRRCGYRQPIFVIPNGIELPKAGSVVTSGDRDAKRLRTLLFLGRIHPKKGLQELLQAWQQCRQESLSLVGNCRLMIAGWDDGGYESNLRAWVQDNGLSDSVDFIGPVMGEAKTRLLAGSDGFVLPSFSEGLPMSVLEAWSFRLPVIMTDHCHLPQGFENDAAIRIAPNPDSIAKGLRQWMKSDDSELGRLGGNGFELVARSFTWKEIASKYLSMYHWMLGGDLPGFAITDQVITP